MAVSFLVPLVAFLFFLLGGVVCLVLAPRLPVVMRVLAAIQFLLVGCFCAFGFLATFEPNPDFMIWRIGYGVLFVGCVGAVARLAMAKSVRLQESLSAE